MAQSDFAEKVEIDGVQIEHTDVMTGDRNQSRFLYYQLKMSMKKAQKIDIIVSFLMESGVRMILKDLKSALDRGAQIEALYALENSRAEGATKGLVQAATGVGKTYLAAFDSEKYERVLFVAHREEILKQAAVSFRNVRKSNDYGFFYGKRKDTDKSVIFASVATLGRSEYLTKDFFAPDYFDYLVIDEAYKGVARFIESIEQECVVLFDEFDKTFKSNKENDEQAKLLSLFDGTADGKKMYIVTCNELYGLNDYIVNRPGRFHYHFRFEYPMATEIREYLEDKLEKKCYGEIDKVIEFAGRINLNYDCLRAIAFELNLGATFEEAIAELNI